MEGLQAGHAATLTLTTDKAVHFGVVRGNAGAARSRASLGNGVPWLERRACKYLEVSGGVQLRLAASGPRDRSPHEARWLWQVY
jgi:hypothetical protein